MSVFVIRTDVRCDVRDVPDIGVARNAKITISGLISQEKLRNHSSKLRYLNGKKGLDPRKL
jgi:hypothetical protein